MRCWRCRSRRASTREQSRARRSSHALPHGRQPRPHGVVPDAVALALRTRSSCRADCAGLARLRKDLNEDPHEARRGALRTPAGRRSRACAKSCILVRNGHREGRTRGPGNPGRGLRNVTVVSKVRRIRKNACQDLSVPQVGSDPNDDVAVTKRYFLAFARRPRSVWPSQ